MGGVLVWYSSRKIEFDELVACFINANYFWISLGVFFGILSHLSRAYRWKYMLEPMGYSLRFSNSIMAVFSGYLINYTIPRAGEVSRATILSNYEKIPFEKGFGTIVAERVADVLVMMLIIGFTLIWKFDIIYKILNEKLDLQNQLFILSLALFLFYFFYQIIKKGNHPFLVKIRSFLSGFLEGIMSISRMEHKWAFIVHTCFIWAMYILMFYVTSFTIESISQLPFSVILIGFIAASLSIAATNGGIGAYPVAVSEAFLIFNIDEKLGLCFGWIMWSSHTAMIVVMGGLSLVFLRIYNRIYPKTN